MNENGSSSFVSLEIVRISSFSYSARNVSLFIDGICQCALGPGDTHKVQLRPGDHAIGIVLGKRSIGYATFRLTKESDAKIEFKVAEPCKFYFYGSAIYVREDMLPRNYTISTSESNSSTPASQPLTRNNTIPPPQQSTRKSSGSGCLWMILGVILFLVLLYFLVPGFSAGLRLGFLWGLNAGK